MCVYVCFLSYTFVPLTHTSFYLYEMRIKGGISMNQLNISWQYGIGFSILPIATMPQYA